LELGQAQQFARPRFFKRREEGAVMLTKVQWSWAVFAIGVLVGIFLGVGSATAGSRGLAALVNGYVFWALLWGWPAAWKSRQPALARLGSLITLENQIAKLALRWTLFYTWILLFSVLGGGIYEYVHARRMPASRPGGGSLTSFR
jgi:hypothetical protein